MTDRELLEAAARAAGHTCEVFVDGKYVRREVDGQPVYWNPLQDDGDALRLAVKLRMYVDAREYGVVAFVGNGDVYEPCVEEINGEPYAATRRAIVRAAAAMASQESPPVA
jgi:hypothetical protein